MLSYEERGLMVGKGYEFDCNFNLFFSSWIRTVSLTKLRTTTNNGFGGAPTLFEPVISLAVRSICPLKLIHFTKWNSRTTTQLQLIFYYFSDSKIVFKFSLPFFSSLGFKSYGRQILSIGKKKLQMKLQRDKNKIK